MYIDDRNAALATPSGGPPMPLTWHDYRDTKLNAAFTELGRRRDTYKKRTTRKPFWRRWYVYGPVVAFAAITGSFTSNTPLLLLVSVPTFIFVLIMDVLLPWLAKMRFQALALGIRRGDFGHAVMWEGDLVWVLLVETLAIYGLEPNMLFRNDELNKRVTPLLTAMLNKTATGRKRLEQFGVSSNHAGVTVLTEHVARAATEISAIYGDYEELREQ